MGQLKQYLEKLKWSHVLIAIVAIGAYAYFMLDQSEIEMRTQGIELGENEINNYQRKIEEAKAFELEFEERKKKYAELVRDLQKQQGALPKQFFMADLLQDFLKEADKVKLQIDSLRADASPDLKELYNSLGFTMEAKGSFLQLLVFLDQLANRMKRLVSVESISIQQEGDKSVTLGGQSGAFAMTGMTGGENVVPLLKATIRLVTYSYRGDGAGAGSAPGAEGGR